MTATAKTASDAYTPAKAEALRLLDAIRTRIADHAHDQQTEPKDWGYVGDMDRWVHLLREVAGEADE